MLQDTAVNDSNTVRSEPVTDSALTVGPPPAQEVWLLPNRRALLVGMVVPLAILALGVTLVLRSGLSSQLSVGWVAAGGGLCLAGGTLLALLLWQMKRPRIAYQEGQVRFYLRSGPPLDVPVRFVEAFFVGRSPVQVHGTKNRAAESVNLVARISERASDWQQAETRPELGTWCGGYVTIRGAWCEPLNQATIRRLNRRLAEVNREQHV